MKLTDMDKKIFNTLGHPEKDMEQIEKAITKTIYMLNDKEKISYREAIKVLGREKFLSGIGRSAFHWSALQTNGNHVVSFDSSKLFDNPVLDEDREEERFDLDER